MHINIRKASIFLIDAFIILLFMIDIKLPGVYFDSAISDYVASTIVHPEIDNHTGLMMSHVGLPLLGGLYHGSLSMFPQLLVLSIFHASQLTLRVMYIIYVVICADILFMTVLKIKANTLAAICSAILCGISVPIMTITRTQYDIMLPGTIFFLLCIYCLCCIYKDEQGDYYKKRRMLYLAGICLGMSFYGYFCFLFFIAGVLIISLKAFSKNKLGAVTVLLLGFITGCSLYFCGYADSLFTNILGYTNYARLALAIFTILFYTILIIPAVSILRCRKTNYLIVHGYSFGFVLAIAAMLLVLFFMRGLIKTKLGVVTWNGVTERSNDSHMLDVLTNFFILYFSLCSGRAAELQINGTFTSVFAGIFGIAFMLIVVMFIVVSFINHKRSVYIPKIEKYIYLILALYLSYYICSMPIVKVMQEQHFVPLLIVSFLLVTLIGLYFAEIIEKKLDNRKINAIVISLVVVICSLNMIDFYSFYNELRTTGGVGAYSNVLNELFEKAYEHSVDNNDVYFLVYPGIQPSFIYMTDNNIKVELLYDAGGTIDTDKISEVVTYLDNGYNVFLLSVYYESDDILHILAEEEGVSASGEIYEAYDSNDSLVYSVCALTK